MKVLLPTTSPFFVFSFFVFTVFSMGCNTQPSSKGEKPMADSLNYETITLINSYNNCEPTAEGCTYISLEYPQFTNAQSPLLDSIKRQVEQFIGGKEDGKNFEPSDLIQLFVEEYASFVKKDTTYKTPWTLERSAIVKHQNQKTVTLEFTEYIFEGGAHPNCYVGYTIIEKNSGKQQKLSDYFDTIAIVKLTALAEPIFCGLKGINPNTSLEKAGYWFANNRFALNNNFYFSEKGLTFFYNNYEIGPYVMGSTELTIPAPQLVKLMKK